LHPAGFETVVEDDCETTVSASPARRISRVHSHEPLRDEEGQEMNDCASSLYSEDLEAQHHHHVAQNAFLSIGLQTSIAIALHKFPEGFITYATNHANPSLGFSVFLALFVHNISEGFAMALPLYMALNSRWKAMLWSSLLGGLSQPLGAAIAVAWLNIANRTHTSPSPVVYGCLFAATAGIMASVALQLFVESLSLNHNRNLSIFCAFLGMALLGLSSAFTSEH
jgi:ZIP family zinc transporter